MCGMSPRIIHIPLSGGDRKAQAKGIRYAHGLHASVYVDDWQLDHVNFFCHK